MKTTLTAKASITINAPLKEVWNALINPDMIKKYMHGMEPVSDWKTGSKLIWIGKPGEKESDHARGIITEMEPLHSLQYTFFFPGYGLADEDLNYNRIACTVSATTASETYLTVSQGDFSVFPNGETYRNHSQGFWEAAVKTLKTLLEEKTHQ